MSRRTNAEWLSLFEAQKQSGLTAEAFCKQHGISPSYFSTRKSELLQSAVPFARAIVANHAASKVTLQWQGVTLQLDRDVSPAWLANVMQALSS